MLQNRNDCQNRLGFRNGLSREIRSLAAVLSLVSGSALAFGQCIDHAACCESSVVVCPELNSLASRSLNNANAKAPGWTMLESVALAQPTKSPMACFAEGTVLTPEMMKQWRLLRGVPEADIAPDYYVFGTPWNWQSNVGAYVTYSLVPDGTSLGDGYTSSLFSMMDSKFGGDRALWTGYIRACFDAISQVCGVRFAQEPDDGALWPTRAGIDGVRGDIRISAGAIDGTNRTLAYAYGPTNGDMRLDTAEDWGRFPDAFRFFRNIFTHELGHSMGLAHSCPGTRTKLMEPFLSTNFDILQHDDILGLQALYGDAQEPDNSASLAKVFLSQQNTSLEFFSFGQVADTATASLVPNDQDWTKSTLVASMPVTFSARPVGRSYDTSQQNSDGSCASGNVVNSLAQTGLRVEIRDAAGNIIAASQGTPGQWVTVTAQVSQGDYYSVVKPVSASFGMPQMYTLTRTIGAPQAPSNDRWFEGILLGQMPYGMIINGTTVGATTDGMATFQPGGTLGTQDVYYNFTPWDGPGRIRITVTGSHLISVHRQGISAPTPQNQWFPINQNLNNGLGGVLEVNINDFSDCIIRVAVAPGGTPGPHTVSVRYMDGPANDTCAAPVDITTGTYNGTTIFARPEPTPYPTSCTTDSFTLPWGAWYRFTAPSEGTLALSACNAQNTIMGVYDGCPESGGNLIACNDNAPSCGNGGSALSIPVIGGRQYLVRVSHIQNLSGNFQLNVAFNRDADECDTASPIAMGNTAFSNVGYTSDNSTCFSGANRWYRYTATGYSTVTATTCGNANFDTTLAAWNSCPSGGGALITCNDDACGLQSSISFQSYPGQQFLLAAGGYNGSTGTGTINISETPIPGEICTTPIVVTTGSIPFSTVGHYTDGPAETNCNFCCGDPQIHGDMWYAYLATGTGTLTVSSCGANYDSKMVAYTDCPFGDGQAIACADDECGVQAQMTVPVVAGENYLLRVGGYGGWTGAGTLTLTLTPECPADFNADTVVDFFDYLDFVDAFSSADPAADFNSDSVIDFFDYLDFVDAFSAGC